MLRKAPWRLALLACLTACSAGADLVQDSDDRTAAVVTAASLTPVLKTQQNDEQSDQKALRMHRLAALGNASNGDLASLQYYITSVQICQNMNLRASGFTDPQGCLEIYRGPQHEILNNPNLAAAASPNAWSQANYVRSLQGADLPGYIDLMDGPSLAALGGNVLLRAENLGTYAYGFVSWAAPVRVQASMSLLDANGVLVTHDGTSTLSNRNGVSTLYTQATQSFAQGDDELAVVTLPSTQSWFKFQQPLQISAADLSNKSQIIVELNFNADGVVYAYSTPSATAGFLLDGPSNAGPVHVIEIPALKLVPVAHLADQSVVQQTYLATVSSGTTARFDARIELFTVAGDANNLIHGVASDALPNPLTGPGPLSFPRIAFVQRTQDGSLNLQDWNRQVVVGGLRPGTQIGDTAAARIACTRSGSNTPLFGGCTADGFAANFTLTNLSPNHAAEVELGLEAIDEDE